MPVSPLPASWSRPASSRSGSVAPSARREATTSSPWRRSATCIESNSASCAGEIQAARSARSAGDTLARRCDRNWRTLPAHQEAIDPVDEGEQQLAADRVARRQEEHRDQQQEPVLLEERADLVLGLAIERREEDLRRVERRDRDEVEDHQ